MTENVPNHHIKYQNSTLETGGWISKPPERRDKSRAGERIVRINEPPADGGPREQATGCLDVEVELPLMKGPRRSGFEFDDHHRPVAATNEAINGAAKDGRTIFGPVWGGSCLDQ